MIGSWGKDGKMRGWEVKKIWKTGSKELEGRSQMPRSEVGDQRAGV